MLMCEATTALEPDAIAAFKALGDAQRGAPEQAMLNVQHATGGGVLNPVVDHVGDITHRMSHMAQYNQALGREKVEKTYRWLTNPYGFAREFNENLRNNARYRQMSEHQLRTKVSQLLMTYAAEHAKSRPLEADRILILIVEQVVGMREHREVLVHCVIGG